MPYSTDEIAKINQARSLAVDTGKNPYAGAGATALSASQGLGAITAESIGTISPLKVPALIPSTGADGMTGFISSYAEQLKAQQEALATATAEAETAKDAEKTGLVDTMKEYLGIQGSRAGLEEQAGIAGKAQKATDATNQIEASLRAQTNELRALDGLGLTDVQKGQRSREVNRRYAFEQADYALIQSAANRDYETATNIINRKIELQLEPLKTKLEFQKLFYEDNKDAFNKKEERQFQALSRATENQLTLETANKTAIANIQLEALKQGVEIPANVLKELNSAKDALEATNILARNGITLNNPLDDQLKQANIDESKAKALQALTSLSPAAQTRVQGIAGQFDAEQAVKNYQTSAEAIDALNSAGSSPTDDIGRIYAFAKVMDPNSVVREGEYKTVQDYSTALLERTGLKAKRVFSNTGFLTEEARTFMKTTLDNRLSSSKKAYDNIYSEYGRRIDKVTGGTDGTDYITDYSRAFDPPTTQNSPQEKSAIDQMRKDKIPDSVIEQVLGHPISFNSVGNTSVSIPKSSRLSYANNNPGNLRFAGQTGATKGEGGFARFATTTAGFNALVGQIKLDASRGLSLSAFINKFAPPSENDTKTYIKNVTSAMGASANTPISKLDLNKLAKAIAKHESGTKIT